MRRWTSFEDTLRGCFEQRHGRVDARAAFECGSGFHVLGVVVFDCSHGADLKGLNVVLVRSFGARLDVVQGLDLATYGKSLLLADRSST